MASSTHQDKGTSMSLSDSPQGMATPALPPLAMSTPTSAPTTAVAGPGPVTTTGGATPEAGAGAGAGAGDVGPPVLPVKDRPSSTVSNSGGLTVPGRTSQQPERATFTRELDRTLSMRSHGDRPVSIGVLDTEGRGMPLPLPLSYLSTGGPVSRTSPERRPQPLVSMSGPDYSPQRMDSYMSDGDGKFSTFSRGQRDTLVGHANGPDVVQRDLARQSAAPGVDWIVPTRSATYSERRDTVSHRLTATLELTRKRQLSCAAKAKLMGRSLNAAIGLQIVIGSLITGLAAVTTGRQTSIMTSVLGAFSTIIASFLARMRGSAEPDLSKARAKGYDTFIRKLEAYVVDFGDEPAKDHHDRIMELRKEFEDLEGSASAEQKGNNV